MNRDLGAGVNEQCISDKLLVSEFCSFYHHLSATIDLSIEGTIQGNTANATTKNHG
jgi:hypothetical protein